MRDVGQRSLEGCCFFVRLGNGFGRIESPGRTCAFVGASFARRALSRSFRSRANATGIGVGGRSVGHLRLVFLFDIKDRNEYFHSEAVYFPG
jgi:hypothetical protein